jgi:hypothetical protein
MRAILTAALATGLVGLAGARPDDKKADPVGTWKCEYEIGGQKRESTLKIKKDGDKLVGTMTWQDKKESNLKDVKLKDGELTFSAEREVNDMKFVIKLHFARFPQTRSAKTPGKTGVVPNNARFGGPAEPPGSPRTHENPGKTAAHRVRKSRKVQSSSTS